MASSKDYIDYVCEQLAGAGEIRAKKMFGEWGIYCDDKFCACVCNNQLFVKMTKAAEDAWPDTETAPPYEGARPYFLLPDVEDRDFLAAFLRTTCAALPEKKPKTKKK
ncbi:TfoX/Sxy family protein [Ruminococcaceae bacterium OttesenSCG-928-I18]|nr:TfoX/Sxy family protein [Ruminococcaceae bacterium OttesenSCG-928-I18]